MAHENEKKSNEPDWSNWFSYEGMLANPGKWLESADILTAALSFMRPILDTACKEFNEGRVPQPRDNLSYLKDRPRIRHAAGKITGFA